MTALLAVLRRHFILAAVAALIILLAGFYIAGFRLGPGLSFVRVGTLEVADIPADTEIYVDQVSRGTVGSGTRMSLVPGSHVLIVGAPGYEPWSKIIVIKQSETTTVSPTLVSKDPTILRLSDEEAATTAREAIATAVLPTESAPLITNCAAVFVSDNRVIADVASSTPDCTPPDFLCTDGSCEPTLVLAPVDPLRSIVLFPGHPDALIIALGGSLYVLGIDPRTPQFFVPLFVGADIAAGALDDGSIVFSNNGRLYSIEL